MTDFGPSPSSQALACGIVAQIGVPECGAEREDHAVMIRVALFLSPGSGRSVKTECSAFSRTSSYLPPGGNAGKTASRDFTSWSPIGATSFVPVISIHGIFTCRKPVWARSPFRGLLGLKAMAALIRLSVSDVPPTGKVWPLTACVVTAPNEWPDMPIFFISSRPCKCVVGVLIPMIELVEHGGNVFHAEHEVVEAGRLSHGGSRSANGLPRHTPSSLPGCWTNTAT